MPQAAEVSLPSDSEIRVVREFDAPLSLVYRAFTRPDLVRRWLLGPPGWSMPVCDMDLRVGGTYRYRWRNDADGTEFGFRGEYRRVEPESRIDSTEYPDEPGEQPGMEVVTRFVPMGERTRVEYLMRAGSREARDFAIGTGMTDGMEMSFKLLDALLVDGVR